MKVVAYYRFSTDNKNQLDNSEDRQRDSVERVVFGRGWRLVGSFTDEAVGGTESKPELSKLRELIESKSLKIDVIAIDSLSRLTRHGVTKLGEDLGWIRDNQVLLSVANKNNGEPFPMESLDDDLGLMVDAWGNNKYIKDLSRAVTNGMKTKFSKDQIGWIGQAPYGYDLIRVIDEKSFLRANSDLSIVEKIFRHVLNGGAIRECAFLLAETEKFKRSGAAFPSSNSVKNILNNAIYCGIRTFGVRGVGKFNTVSGHKKKWVEQNPLVQCLEYRKYEAIGFKPCITYDEFVAVQEILRNNRKNGSNFSRQKKNLYTGLLKCAHCGYALVYANARKKKGYVCPLSANGSGKCCSANGPARKQVLEEALTEKISEQLAAMFTRPKFHWRNLEILVERILKRKFAASNSPSVDLELQRRRLEELTALYLKTSSRSLSFEIEKQSKILDELQEGLTQSNDVDQLLLLAEEQFARIKEVEKSNPLLFYLGFLYKQAAAIASIENLDERENAIADAGFLMANTTLSSFAEVQALVECHTGQKIDGTIPFRVAGDSFEVLNALKQLGLKHIRVEFFPGVSRGKPKMVVGKLVFCFSVATHNRTLKDLVLSSDEMYLQ